jgi:hypothetical protein
MKITITNRKPKPKKESKQTVTITIPKSFDFRGGETGKVIRESDNIVVQFRDGGTVGYPRELFGRGEV